MKNADLFAMLSQATEFDQIQVRENELDELTAILESDHCPMEVKVSHLSCLSARREKGTQQC